MKKGALVVYLGQSMESFCEANALIDNFKNDFELFHYLGISQDLKHVDFHGKYDNIYIHDEVLDILVSKEDGQNLKVMTSDLISKYLKMFLKLSGIELTDETIILGFSVDEEVITTFEVIKDKDIDADAV